ncbi:helix-turn-helix transcriptional regulator [Pelomonas sp. SE-A7]|uniref:helix-turn-helix domain-containing protein n=1 Tax=Pelomonas sp. SE-A7 TaxID=3054953 RepID=UPI00259CC126|nr:helix-turn-helix transcriptional regulator [Pelomonas sp. SE-A7]MDM4767164.1 helix-turn-helix transcriptional regulator [Pelomonas sp. SE-A7]
MLLYPPQADLALLETEAVAGGAAALTALAWALRQRDSRRALTLADQARQALGDETGAAAQRVLIRLALIRSEIAAMYSQFDEAEDRLAQARRQLAEWPDPMASGDALLAEAAVAKARGQRERELEAYGRAAAVYGEARLLDRQAQAQAWEAYERSFAQPELALSETLVADPACDALWSAARALRLSRRELAESASLFLHASEQAQRVGLLRLAVVCVMNAGTALQSLGEIDDAVACFDLAEGVAQQTGWPALLGASQTRLAALFNELGRPDEAHAMAGAALRSLAATPGGINRANACGELARSLLLLGRGIEAVAHVAEAIRMYREASSTDNLALCLINQARALAAAAQPEAALAAIAECEQLSAIHGFSALQVDVYEALAEIHRRHPDLPAPAGMTAATAALHYARATLEEGRRLPGWKPQPHLFRLLAEDCAAAGDWQEAYGHARRAVELLETRPIATPVRGAPVSDAAGLWRPAFAAPLPDEADGHAALRLTPKEHEVLKLLALNYANKEIATAMAIGDETVKWHLKKVYAKLDAGSRKHAVTRARALGLL